MVSTVGPASDMRALAAAQPLPTGSPATGRQLCAPRAAVAAVAEVIREVVLEELEPLSKGDLLGLLSNLDETARLLETCRAKVLSAVERTEAWRGEGRDASLAAWRARTTRTGQGKAHREVSTARTVTAMPGAADALAEGHMTPEQAESISRVATSGGAQRRSKIADALADPESSRELLEAAKHLDAPQFARAAEAWAARLDPLMLEADHEAQRRARFLSVADTPGGTVLKGRLDKMAGHRLRLALEAVTPVPSAADTRDHGQRAADALDALAQGALADPASKPGGHVPPDVSVIMTEQTLAGLRALADSARETSGPADRGREASGPADRGREASGPAVHGREASGPVDRGRAASGVELDPATLEDGTPVPISETARSLCDAQVTRIVVGADSTPVDLGRTKRLWIGAQRRLVIARDRHCAFAGCDIPARWCEIHHIAWWARDRGATDIANAVLLCSSHHGLVHAENLTLAREPAPPGPPGAGLVLARYSITDPRGRDWSAPPMPPISLPPPGALVPDASVSAPPGAGSLSCATTPWQGRAGGHPDKPARI